MKYVNAGIAVLGVVVTAEGLTAAADSNRNRNPIPDPRASGNVLYCTVRAFVRHKANKLRCFSFGDATKSVKVRGF